jgi:RNA polymerase sigma-70 factor (ECF subfamily)
MNMKNVSDFFYIQRVRSGDIRAFSGIVEKYQQLVLTIIIKIVENREDAEDIAQEVFIKVFKSLDQFNAVSEFSTWLYRIAYNTTLSELRKRKLTFASMDEQVLMIDEPAENDWAEEEKEKKLQYLDKALKQLAPDETFLISLYYMDKQSVENISKITGISVSNVKVKLHRTRKKLALIMDKFIQDENR